ncbi:16373_t:CDS:2, partial [Dentiscutata erythropus]
FGEKNNNVTSEEKKLSDCCKKQNIDQIDKNKIKFKIESCPIENLKKIHTNATSQYRI